jgi:hypothetical protein
VVVHSNDPDEPDKIMSATLHCPDAGGSTSTGDPHFRSYDGWGFDFQGGGLYWLTLNETGSVLIQTQQEPFSRNRNVTVNTGIAVLVADDRPGGPAAFDVVRSSLDLPLQINDQVIDAVEGWWRLDSGGIAGIYHDCTYVYWPTGETLWTCRYYGTWSMNISVHLPETRSGKITGLFGDFDGNRQNDIALRDGTVLEAPYSFEDLQLDFGGSWAVLPEESLFDGEGGFTQPSEFVDVNTLPEEEKAAATEVCVDAGIEDENLKDWCIIDVATAQDAGLADNFTTTEPPVELAPYCCKVCSNGKACGDSCIDRALTCTRPPGAPATPGDAGAPDLPALPLGPPAFHRVLRLSTGSSGLPPGPPAFPSAPLPYALRNQSKPGSRSDTRPPASENCRAAPTD